MRVLSAADVRAALPMSACVAAAAAGLASQATVPERPRLRLPRGDLLFMPGAAAGVAAGVKVVGVFPDNPARGLPATLGVMLLVDEETGVPAALLDGTSLTSIRTGAVTGVATQRLARPDAAVVAVLGAGGLAADQIAGVRAVRPIAEVRLWNRTRARAERLAGSLAGVTTRVLPTAAAAVAGADVVVCCTSATEPVLQGAWLAPGTLVCAVGAYTPETVEVDAECVRRAAIVAADSVAEAVRTGDLAGRIDPAAVVALPEAPPRAAATDIVLFKSVGTAALDLACAQAAVATGRGTDLALS